MSKSSKSDLPDWRLPSGVSRSLWNYVRSEEGAAACDDRLASDPSARRDLAIAGDFLGDCRAVIDIGCGTGRLLSHLAAGRRKLVGIDLSMPMLSLAAQRIAGLPGQVDLLRMNFVELDAFRDESFDGAACLFSTLGMILSPGHRATVVQQVHRLLKSGGRFLLHAHNVWFHLHSAAGRRWLVCDRWRRLRGSADFGNYCPPIGGADAPTLHHFSRYEVVRMLRDAGFRIRLVEPLGLDADGRLPSPWWLPGFRAYGFLVGAEKRQA